MPKPKKPRERKKRLLWSEAMKRGLDLDVLKCGFCGIRREVLKCITDPKVIDRILTHLGLKTVLPEVAPVTFPRRCRDPYERGKLTCTRAARE